jgi:hypothetical protein
VAEAWERAAVASGLPVVLADPTRGRPRVAFGAPLPVDVVAERELIDCFLTDRLPIADVRERILRVLPGGWTLVDLFDVWLPGPALPGSVTAGQYRIELEGAASEEVVAAAAERIVAARRLPRERVKGGGTVAYDLRPLLVDVGVCDPGPPVRIRARTRFHPELGTGRPEEVVAALADAAGVELVARSIVREGLVIGDPAGPIV